MSQSCDEYYDTFRVENRRARKEHVCCACERTIRKGDIYGHTFSAIAALAFMSDEEAGKVLEK